MSSTSGMIVYLVFIIAIFYFMAIRPQSKEKKKQAELMATVAVGDSVNLLFSQKPKSLFG